MSSIIIYYPESLEVFEIIRDANNIEVKPNESAIFWTGGGVGGLSLPFVIIDEETDGEELETIPPEWIELDKSAEYVKEDLNQKLFNKLNALEKRLEQMEGRTNGNPNI